MFATCMCVHAVLVSISVGLFLLLLLDDRLQASSIPDDSSYALIEPECRYLLALGDLEDWEAGAILLSMSLFIMIVSLLVMVKLLNSLLKGNEFIIHPPLLKINSFI